MMRNIATFFGVLCLAACANTKPEQVADLTAAYNVAAAAEAVYAADASANGAKVAEAQRLLSAAQAALLTWSNSSLPADQTAASAAIAALVAYEASLPATSVATSTASH
jgi:hypothetical protein